MSNSIEKRLIASMMTQVYKMGLTTISGGNISIRTEGDIIHITPSGIDKGSLSEIDIVTVDNNGISHGIHKRSSEYPFHKQIYQTRKDIHAIIHAHPIALVAISAARKLPQIHHLENVLETVKSVSMAKYALPSSELLGNRISKIFSQGYDVVLLENHGIVVGASSLDEAYKKLECLEFYVNSEIAAMHIGKLDMSEMKLVLPKIQWQINPSQITYERQKNELVKVAKRIYEHKLSTNSFTIVSTRIDEHTFIMTPSNRDISKLDKSSIVTISINDTMASDLPDPISVMIQEIYHTNEEIKSLIIATPCQTMAFAISNATLNTRIIPEGYILLKDSPKIDPNYEVIISTISRNTPVVIVKNHFIMTAGANLLQAYDRLEVLEFGANSMIKALSYGRVHSIDETEIDRINQVFDIW